MRTEREKKIKRRINWRLQGKFNKKKMIQFQFADMREKAKWTKIKFDNELVSMNVDEGLNLGGHCENKLHDGSVCKAYNVLQVGMLSKSEKQEDVQKLRDVKKEAFNRITEEIP